MRSEEYTRLLARGLRMPGLGEFDWIETSIRRSGSVWLLCWRTLDESVTWGTVSLEEALTVQARILSRSLVTSSTAISAE